MTREEYLGKLTSLVKPFVNDPNALANINEDTDLIEDLKINSARLVDIILEIEDVFNITVSDEESDNFIRIRDVIDLLELKLN